MDSQQNATQGRHNAAVGDKPSLESLRRTMVSFVLVGLLWAALDAQIIIRNKNDPDNLQSPAGVVNWLDTLAYVKPAFVPITVPNEAVATKYWIDFTSGAGSTCSQASPCDDVRDLSGKAGMSGGPAYVYLKGTTGAANPFHAFNLTMAGSAGNEIVFKPWPAGSPGCATECTAVMIAVDESSGNGTIEGGTQHHLIFDGGPDLKLIFQSGNSGNEKALRINVDSVTMYRIQGRCTPGTQVGNGIFYTGTDGSNTTNLRIINSEFHDCKSGDASSQQSALYIDANTCFASGGYGTVTLQNNIVRNMGGEGIEINPRSVSTGPLSITGNAFHDIGKQTCGAGDWSCRPAVTIDDCGGSASGITIINNLAWDLGSAFAWTKGAGSTRVFEHNTIYDYGKGSGFVACNEAFCGGTAATMKNNIIVPTNGTNPFDGGSYTTSNNACPSAESCGTAKVTFTTTDWLSVTENAVAFLTIGTSSPAKDAGTTPTSTVSIDYIGTSRPQNSLYDVGAYEFIVAPAPIFASLRRWR